MGSERRVKQGNMCLAVDGSAVHALDCDEAASLGASNFFQVAAPAYDPKAVVTVRSLGELLRPVSWTGPRSCKRTLRRKTKTKGVK